ncbi:MAG TPA: hypothetical protein VE967_13730 [Gemmatimonadaceae bacterium]|nr:hypothetical protein [Gemmatimonadaceae bacterium]
MRARFLFSFVATVAAVSTAAAQSKTPALTISAAGKLYPEGYYFGAESPNKRFVVVGGEDSFIRFDRKAGDWKVVSGVSVGNFVTWSPNGRFIASSYRDGAPARTIWILPVDTATGLPTGTARRITTRPGAYPAWSPDSRRIAFASSDSGRFRIVVAPFNGGTEEVVYEGTGGGGEIAWSPDGQHLMFGTLTTESVSLWHYLDLRTKQRSTFEGARYRMIGFSSDGSKIARLSQATGMLEISTPQGQLLQRFTVPARAVPYAWSATNPNEFSATQQVILKHMERAPLEGGALSSMSPIDSAPLTGIKFSPDGRQMAFWRGMASGGQRIFIANADGSGARAIGDAEFGGPGLDWSPSGREIAYVIGAPSTAVRVIDVQSGKARDLVRPAGAAAIGGAVKWRSDGLAVRYISRPKGLGDPAREAREMTLDGTDRLLASAPIASPQGEQPFFANDTLLLLKSLDRGVETVNLRTRARRVAFSGTTSPGNTYLMGVSADGAWTAFPVWDNQQSVINLFSLRTGESRRIANPLGGQLGEIYFAPDGKNLVVDICIPCRQGTEKFDIAVFPINGDAPHVLTSSQPGYREFGEQAISPDGKSVFFVGAQSWNTRIVTLTVPKQ